MKKILTVLFVPVLVLFGLWLAPAAMNKETNAMSKKVIDAGEVELIRSFDVGDSPEGIALDPKGNLFVGNRHPVPEGRSPQIVKSMPDGSWSVFATLPLTENPQAESLLGLVTDAQGSVYAALHSMDATTQGVWKVDMNGVVNHLAGSEQIQFPNGLAFDARGSLYVTDSFGAAIWRMDKEGQWQLWVKNDLLKPNLDGFPGMPLPGANGIAFFPPDQLYVANTGLGLIARIQILPDGSPGVVTVVAQDAALLTVDGIAVDVKGDIYAVIAGSAVIGNLPLVKVDRNTGLVTPLVVDENEIDKFDFPLSIAFAVGPRDQNTVFITNGALPIPTQKDGPGPGVIQVSVGERGFP
jgi:sugar lactone lactonase YvrE